MKYLTAVIVGLLPALALSKLGVIQNKPLFFYVGLITAIAAGLIYYVLDRWPNASVLTILTMGGPILFYVYVAVFHPIFLPLFYGSAGLVLLACLLGALISGDWSWVSIGKKLAFFCTILLMVYIIAGRFSLEYIEAGMLAAGAYAVSRLCDLDFLSWMRTIPLWINRGMEKVWY